MTDQERRVISTAIVYTAKYGSGTSTESTNLYDAVNQLLHPAGDLFTDYGDEWQYWSEREKAGTA
jgi:hypothetical protein